MDEWPNVVCGQVGISAHAWTVFERDTYRPVCLQRLPMRRPGCSRVRWVEGLAEAALKCRACYRTQPGGLLGSGARQDNSTHKPTSKVNQSVLRRSAALPLPHAPTNRRPTPPNTRANRLRAGYHGPARNQSPRCPLPPPPYLYPLVPAWHCRPPWAQAQEAAVAIPLRPAPTPASTGSAAPPLWPGPIKVDGAEQAPGDRGAAREAVDSEATDS